MRDHCATHNQAVGVLKNIFAANAFFPAFSKHKQCKLSNFIDDNTAMLP
jgi:hypothetical protein